VYEIVNFFNAGYKSVAVSLQWADYMYQFAHASVLVFVTVPAI